MTSKKGRKLILENGEEKGYTKVKLKSPRSGNSVGSKLSKNAYNNNNKENKSRTSHDCQPDEQVLRTRPSIMPKSEDPRTGPYIIITVHNNGTLTI